MSTSPPPAEESRPGLYPHLHLHSLYLSMRDGVQLALEVLLPAPLLPGERLPTIVSLTRYWRALEFRLPLPWGQRQHPMSRFLVSHGYARVLVDVRGSGASFGTQAHPFSREERQDMLELVNWIVAQPWSNGMVGALGDSYAGTTAELLALTGHPAVKAVISRFNEFDLYTDLIFPGGVRLDWFVRTWNAYNQLLDANRLPPVFGRLSRLLVRGVKPVDADQHRQLLRTAIQAHQANGNLAAATETITYRDDRVLGVSLDEISLHTAKVPMEQAGVAISGWGSWLDAGTADAVLKRFLTWNNPQQAMIGPWNHGAFLQASPYQPAHTPVDPSPHHQWLAFVRFFDRYLKEASPVGIGEKRLSYYTMGEERWKTTTTWPPPGSTSQRWYLAVDQTLSLLKPADETGEDIYPVDFEATTGRQNRWHTQIGGPVWYPDRAVQDRRLLTYTSPPLILDLEITGSPVLTLTITSSETDGAFFAYLEDVDTHGDVHYLTEGLLRALHRQIAKEAPPYRLLVPYHSFRRSDRQVLLPGVPTELTFALLPTSVLVRRGHRLRLSLAGHDRETFARLPAEGNPVIRVARNHRSASFLDLPIIEQH